MKRFRSKLALRFGVSAVAGAVLTVAVAWGTGVGPWPKGGAKRRFAFENDGRWFTCYEQQLWWVTNLHIERVDLAKRNEKEVQVRGPGEIDAGEVTLGRRPPQSRLPRKLSTTSDWQAGVPFRSLWCGRDSDRYADMIDIHGWPGTLQFRAPPWLARHPRNSPLGGMAFVPYAILPLGFALDTAFYGTLVFLLWSAPGVLRRGVRRRRGRCVRCGYDLSGIGGACPECGAAQRKPAVSPAIPSL